MQTEHGVLRHNRQHLPKSPRNTNRGYNHLFDDEEDVEASSSNNQQLPVPVSVENCNTTNLLTAEVQICGKVFVANEKNE